MDFLKQHTRLSFLYGNSDAMDLPHTVEVAQNSNELTTVYTFEDGLKVTNIARKSPKYGTYEWVNYFENTGTENTQIISELWDCDVALPAAHEEPKGASPWYPSRDQYMFVLNPNGSTNVDEFDFYAHMVDGGLRYDNYLFVGKPPKTYQSIGGRSSDGNAPFFNIHQAGRGYLVGIGWTGQWNCEIARNEDSVSLKTKIEDTHFVLYPGERIRTSSVVIMPYEASVEDSQNLWRRMMREEYSPTLPRIGQLPLCVSFWGGTESHTILERIDQVTANEIPFEYFWIDAGWCGHDTLPTSNEYTGDWGSHVGDWVVSPLVHPNGLLDVAERIKQKGKKFVLWFEPERVRKTVPLATEHPEYLLDDPTNPNNKNLLLNLGNPDAFAYISEALCDTIARLGVDCYRQDFNFRPLPFWRANDTPDRRGITEIKHIMGLYRLWDLLLERFPKLMIDNCASGGKRLDMETAKRSFPLWRSDAQCPADPNPEITQVHNMNFSLWLPYTGTGSGRLYDTYRMRSAYAPGLSTTYAYSDTEHFGAEDGQIEWFKARCEEMLRVRPYFAGDVYHLTAPIKDSTAWCAIQWDRPEQGDGMVQVFRREQSPYSEAFLPLRRVDPNKLYHFSDIDGGEFTVSGKELAENGLHLIIRERRVAKLLFYQTYDI